jgi:hypothetical protein
MDTQKTQVAVVRVTPEMAKQWLIENLYEYQRPLKASFVTFLADEMRRGAFKQDTQIEFCRVNGHEWLTDGQTRLNAVLMANIPQNFVVTHRCLESEEQIAKDYTHTDRGSQRSIIDGYRVLRLADEFGISETNLKAFGVAVGQIHRGFSNSTAYMHDDDRERLMREYSDAYNAYLESIAGTRKTLRYRLDRGSTIGVALVTFRYSAKIYTQAKVDSFWNGIAMDDGLRAGDARKAALRHLTESGMVGSTALARKTVTSAYSARVLAECFNAYMLGKNKKAPPEPVIPFQPMLILGSPFTGK